MSKDPPDPGRPETSSGTAASPLPPPRLRLRLVFGGGAMLGPGKADLLGLIREEGSIAAAGRRMGMSYKRAWTLVEQMNDAFAAPLVLSSRGGASGGGASLTDQGLRVLDLYRRIENHAETAAATEIAELRGMLRAGVSDMSDGK